MMHMHQPYFNPTSCACIALRKASRVLTTIYDTHLSQHGITITQFSLLRNIKRHASRSLSELADYMVMDRTSLYRTIAPLEKAGWVKIVAAEKGHMRLASLTKTGLAKLTSAEPDWLKAEAEIAESLGTARLANLHSVSSDIIELAKA